MIKKYFILFLSFFIPTGYGAYSPESKIKVKIASNQTRIKISGHDLTRTLVETKKSKFLASFNTISFNCSKVKWKNWKKSPRVFAKVGSKKKTLNWNNQKFAGNIQVQTSENYKGCDLVNEMDMEDYIAMVLPKEMNANWPIEALKAQAIAARSYALFKIRTKAETKKKGYITHYDLENSERHQVNGNYSDLTQKTILAAKATKGEVLVNDLKDKLPIFFHSKCGGHTFLPEEVWSNKVRGYSKVQCPYCHGKGMNNWEFRIKENSFLRYYSQAKLKFDNKYIAYDKEKFRLFKNNEYNPKVQLLGGKSRVYELKKSRLRSMLKRSQLPSNNFKVHKTKKEIKINGAGFGHGVGLCQFGAKEMAERGYNYKEILKHYFPKLNIVKTY